MDAYVSMSANISTFLSAEHINKCMSVKCAYYQMILDGEILCQTWPLLCPVHFCTCVSFKDEKRPSLALAWASALSTQLLCQLSVFVCSCERVGNCERSLREFLGPRDTIGKGLGSETVDFNKATDSK